jgi:hypothetical protein
MPRHRGRKLDRRGDGPFFFILIGFLVFAMYSLAIAVATADDCPGGQSWRFFPPGWECH